MNQTTTTTTTAKELSRALLAQGFETGAPRHVPERHLHIDRACARAMKCGSCGKRGMKYVPFRRGREYRALAACPCGAGEEM
jgi:hypothetical protein